jgi:hypothetical protein
MKRNVFILFLLWPAWAASQGMKVSGELAPLLERARIEGSASTVLAGEVAANAGAGNRRNLCEVRCIGSMG